jgi:hypothetical protein
MPVDARSFYRKMRGGAQAHLIGASDGHAYVVKFSNNPQHRRILINELVAATLFDHLGLTSPAAAVVNFSAEFLRAHPEVHIQTGDKRIPPAPGWHFGSRYPGNPETQIVYDFLPDILLGKTANLSEFLGVLVLDKWLSNADSRQAVFWRARVQQRSAQGWQERTGFVASMIDHGYVFDGPHWTFVDSPIQGLYFRPLVYAAVRSLDSFEPWLSRVLHFPEQVLDEAVKRIPAAWLAGDRPLLEQLLEKLLRRRCRVPGLIEGCRHARGNPFPNWI